MTKGRENHRGKRKEVLEFYKNNPLWGEKKGLSSVINKGGKRMKAKLVGVFISRVLPPFHEREEEKGRLVFMGRMHAKRLLLILKRLPPPPSF